jgi:hypothetical protein
LSSKELDPADLSPSFGGEIAHSHALGEGDALVERRSSLLVGSPSRVDQRGPQRDQRFGEDLAVVLVPSGIHRAS